MKHQFKPTFAALGVGCAIAAMTLAGCNKGDGGATSSIAGAPSGSSSDSLATVGNSKVTRADMNAFLEVQSGEQALPVLIDTQLVSEALKAKSLSVTDAEVDADIARRQAQNPAFAAVVTAGGAPLSRAKFQIKSELGVQKLLTADVKATDAQLKTFFDKYRVYYDQPAKVKMGMLLSSTKTRADLMAAQLKAKSKTMAQLVAEQKKAADQVATNSTESEDLSRFPAPISDRVTPLIARLSQGGVTPVQNFGGQAYAIFVVSDRTPVVKADFDKLKSQVESDYKSAQIAEKTVAAPGTKNPPFDETVRRTLVSLKLQSPTATFNDVLNYINQTAVNNLLAGLRTGGTVQIDDPAYTKIATQYQAAPGAGAAANAATENASTENTATGNTATENTATENAATGNTASGNVATGNVAG